MEYKTPIKGVVCNVKTGTVSVPPSEGEEGRRMGGAIQHRNAGAVARSKGLGKESNPHPKGSYAHVQWNIGHDKGTLR